MRGPHLHLGLRSPSPTDPTSTPQHSCGALPGLGRTLYFRDGTMTTSTKGEDGRPADGRPPAQPRRPALSSDLDRCWTRGPGECSLTLWEDNTRGQRGSRLTAPPSPWPRSKQTPESPRGTPMQVFHLRRHLQGAGSLWASMTRPGTPPGPLCNTACTGHLPASRSPPRTSRGLRSDT